MAIRRKYGQRAAVGMAMALAIPLSASQAFAAARVPDTIVDLGLQVELRAVALLPDSSFGAAPRLNAMATVDGRLFVIAERDGLVYELVEQADGTRAVSLWLDVGAAMTASGTPLNTTSVAHGGLRSLAFHPDFANNGLLYASAVVDRPANAGDHTYLSDVDKPVEADSILVEFKANPQNLVVNPASIREVFRVGMPVLDHPIKQISFDQSVAPGDVDYGLLYVGHGDASVQSAVAGGGRNNDALGKVLRIDPRQSGQAPYSVPANNPFVGDAAMIDEAFSIGHRNPHALTFADGPSGRVLIVAEPGRDNVEEINLIEAGADFGWPEREGTYVHLESGGVETGIDPLPANEATLGFTYPAAQYGNAGAPGTSFNGTAIAGGFVVDNGSELSGNYFFADFPKTGDLFHVSVDDLVGTVRDLAINDPLRDSADELTQAQIGHAGIEFDHDGDEGTPSLVRSSLLDVFDDAATYRPARADVRFGQGPDGELYVMSKRNNTVYLVVNSLPVVAPPPPPPPPPPTTTTTAPVPTTTTTAPVPTTTTTAPVPTTTTTGAPATTTVGSTGPSTELCDGHLVTVDLGAGGSPTSGDDVILGTPRADKIDGLGGDDIICGGGGNDIIRGSAGNDTIFGEAGNDVIKGGSGDDFISGGDGNDKLSGASGKDTLRGDDGADRLRGGWGDDYLWGGLGLDVMYGGYGDDVLDDVRSGYDRMFGNQGNDVLLGRGGNDFLDGGAGSDYISGGEGNDRLLGSGGDDFLTDVGDGVDRMEGGTGNDVILGHGGDDALLNGGPGLDYIWGGSGQDSCVDPDGASSTFYVSCERIRS